MRTVNGINYYTQGEMATVTVQFLNAATDAPVTPTVVTLSVLPYGAAEPTVYTFGVGGEIVSLGNGAYDAQIDTTPATMFGPWVYQWNGTGAAVAEGDSYFNVELAPL